MLSTRSRFRVLSEIAEEELAELSQYSNGDQEAERAQAEARRDRRRTKITQELFDTEKTYLNHLNLINKHFDFPLRFNCLLPDEVHSQIFGNIEQIMEVNKSLLEYMEQTTIGEAFKYLGPFLKLYSTYANNHENAISLLQEWQQKSSSFTDFIHLQEEKPDMMGLKINALLITPVQRVPRYKLLLEDLLENTPDDHHDYNHLKEAVDKVSEIAAHINNHIKQNENFQKMLSIQKSFDKSAPKILAPGREFIKEGVLKKVSRRGGKSHDRMFFLFSDILIYGKPKLLDSGNNSYTCCCVLPLKHCELERVFGSVKHNNRDKSGVDSGGMFKITCKDESLLLFSNEPAEVKEWTQVLDTSIRKLSSNRSTLRKPSSNKAPMRGRSLWKQMRIEKQQDLQIKRIIKPSETDCIKPGLSPRKMFSDLDTNTCLSPRKRPKLSSDRSSTPIHVSQTRSGCPIKPLTLENIPPAQDFKDENFVLSPNETSKTYNIDSGKSCDPQHRRSCDLEENSFLQMTMDDIGDATVDLDSFCKRGRHYSGHSTAQNNQHTPEQPTCSKRPLDSILNTGRQVSRRCRSAIESAQLRIQETKSNCSIQ